MHTKQEIKSWFGRVVFLKIRETLLYDIDISASKCYLPTILVKGNAMEHIYINIIYNNIIQLRRKLIKISSLPFIDIVHHVSPLA